MTTPPSKPTHPRSLQPRDKLSAGAEDKLQALGRGLVSSLYMLIRNVKLYDPDNAIFNKPYEQTKLIINTILAMDGTVNLLIGEGSVYLNSVALRIEIGSLDNVHYLMSEFQRRGVGALVLNQPINIPDLKNFVYIFSRHSQEEVGEQGVRTHELGGIKLSQYKRIVEVLKDENAPTNRQVDRKRYALTVYSRLIYFLRKYFAGLKGSGPSISTESAGRSIQDLVDICFRHRHHFLGLTTLKSDDEYLFFHSANVCLLAIVFGSELGFTKQQLRELGMVALLHDVGKVDLPDEIIHKRENLTEAEMKQVHSSSLYNIKRVLRARQMNRLTIQRIVTSVEHQMDFGVPVKNMTGKTAFVVPRNDIGVFSKIIAICDVFDALTSNRPYRQAFAPQIALSLMWSEIRHKFDPELLEIFMAVMKIPSVKLIDSKGIKLAVF